MLGQTGYLPAANRGRLAMLMAVMAAVLALVVLVPTAAHASGCTDSWTNTKGGSWFEGANWSKKAAPTSEDEACITEPGTYTVTMTQETGSVSVKSLAVGGASGTQTLVVGSSCSDNAILAVTAGIGVGTQGAMTLTNGDGCGNSVTVTGSITSSGTFTVEPDNGGTRTVQGNLTNTGTLAINANTAYSGASALLTNEGALNVAEGKEFAVSADGSVTNGTGGKIVAGLTGGMARSNTRVRAPV
jgi:hypothetical protein